MSTLICSLLERLFYERYRLQYIMKESVVLYMKFKDTLKKLRTSRGLTQEELAHKLDIPESTIRRYESSDEGLPGNERLEIIADFFEVSVDYLLGRKEDKNLVLARELSRLANLYGFEPDDRRFLELVQKSLEITHILNDKKSD